MVGENGRVELIDKAGIDGYGCGECPRECDAHLLIEGVSTADCSEAERPLREESLVVTGNGWILVPMKNDAFVVTHSDFGTLHLTCDAKDSGCCGEWVVEQSGSMLIVCTVKGLGTWRSEFTEENVAWGGRFDIGDSSHGAGCVAAEGPVFLTSGDFGDGTRWAMWLENGSKFYTSGRAVWGSVSDGNTSSAPQIIVSSADDIVCLGCDLPTDLCPD